MDNLGTPGSMGGVPGDHGDPRKIIVGLIFLLLVLVFISMNLFFFKETENKKQEVEFSTIYADGHKYLIINAGKGYMSHSVTCTNDECIKDFSVSPHAGK